MVNGVRVQFHRPAGQYLLHRQRAVRKLFLALFFLVRLRLHDWDSLQTVSIHGWPFCKELCHLGDGGEMMPFSIAAG